MSNRMRSKGFPAEERRSLLTTVSEPGPVERRQAALTVAHYAQSKAECAEFLAMLGLLGDSIA